MKLIRDDPYILTYTSIGVDEENELDLDVRNTRYRLERLMG